MKIMDLFKGLTKEYYFRQLFFGFLFFAGYSYMIWNTIVDENTRKIGFLIFLFINTLLYPYARFAYESIVGFIMGDNVFYINAVFMLLVKFLTMALCWIFAIFIAPIGLLFIYLHQRKEEKNEDIEVK